MYMNLFQLSSAYADLLIICSYADSGTIGVLVGRSRFALSLGHH